MRRTIPLLLICLALMYCKRDRQTDMDDAAFVFNTENIDGDESDYARPAVITGHILHPEVYPNTREISLSMPFFDRVAQQQTSQISEDGDFAFSFYSYSPRSVSMAPFVDELMVCPGDSIHVELDFSDFNHVVFTGRGADNNEKLSVFRMRYYLDDWPSLSEHTDDHEPRYPTAAGFAEAARLQMDSYQESLEAFIAAEHPGRELEDYCRKEIEAGYYRALASQLVLYKRGLEQDVSSLFSIKDVEHLFDGACMNKSLFELTSALFNWIRLPFSESELRRFLDNMSLYINHLEKGTDNALLSQMLVTDLYNRLLNENSLDKFEEYFDIFNKEVSFPLLKLETRDRYLFKKSYQENPRLLSDAILNADRPKDGDPATFKKNEGLELIRSVLSGSEGKVVHICIGASWCIGTQQEKPFLNQMAQDYSGQPVRFVNFYLDDNPSFEPTQPSNIEDFHLTDAQRLGLDPIFHTGRGIPFYLLFDKDGVMVDFGDHLRPSHPSTREAIDKHLR